MNIAIVGSRGFDDFSLLCAVMDEVYVQYELSDTDAVVSGGARGADELGVLWANTRELHAHVFEPNWKLGRHAGLARNTQIVEESDLVVAFWDGKSKGTRDTLNKARKFGVRSRVIIV